MIKLEIWPQRPRYFSALNGMGCDKVRGGVDTSVGGGDIFPRGG